MSYYFRYFKRCLFCCADLPRNPKGEGEHVIPRNIYGFWRVYDVCDECKRYFGDKVDQLAIRNPAILRAMQELKLPEFKEYEESIPFVGEDAIDGHPVRMVRKRGQFRVGVTEVNENFLECPEELWPHVGEKWIRLDLNANIDDKTFRDEMARLEEAYSELQPGESVQSTRLGITIRKSQVRGARVDFERVPSITPLIAKIAAVFLFYAIHRDLAASLPDLQSLVLHARYGQPVRDYFINWCPLFPDESYEKMHAIRMHASHNMLVLDVSLFTYPNWRIILDSTKPVVFQPFRGIEYDTFLLILDFRNLPRKEMVFGFRPQGSREYEYFTYDP